MGHDIYAYRPSEVAYLRKSFTNPTRHKLYEYLDCEEYDNNQSGSGEYASFERSQIKDALVHARADPEPDEPIIEFLEKCLEGMDDEIIICFG